MLLAKQPIKVPPRAHRLHYHLRHQVLLHLRFHSLHDLIPSLSSHYASLLCLFYPCRPQELPRAHLDALSGPQDSTISKEEDEVVAVVVAVLCRLDLYLACRQEEEVRLQKVPLLWQLQP